MSKLLRISVVLVLLLTVLISAQPAAAESLNATYFFTYGWGVGIYASAYMTCDTGAYIAYYRTSDGGAYGYAQHDGAVTGFIQLGPYQTNFNHIPAGPGLNNFVADNQYRVTIGCVGSTGSMNYNVTYTSDTNQIIVSRP